jgi:hypothetical integral membrane protein (TIGR02206 family)
MRDFIHHFFGQGTQVEFENFTLAHFLPLLVTAGVIFLIWQFREKLRGFEKERYFRYVLAFMLILSDMSYYWRLVGMPELGPNPIDHLPVTVCGWAVIFASYMVVGKSQKLFDIVYFWLFCGSVFALITPTVITYTGPTRFRYYQFWLEHTLGYVAVFYMIFVHGMRPTIKSAVRSWSCLAVLGVIAYCTNRYLGPGANYLFLAKPEDTPSVLDILPPNFVLRTLIMVAVITTLYFVAYLPWFLKDRKTKKQTVSAA